ncbi:MAG: hypothetical protein ACJAQT_000516 [Akkermansiaceae bacterium]|jgi:hypothetical protein
MLHHQPKPTRLTLRAKQFRALYKEQKNLHPSKARSPRAFFVP